MRVVDQPTTRKGDVELVSKFHRPYKTAQFYNRPCQRAGQSSVIDDIGTEIIAMHYGIVWGERQRVFRQD